MTLSCVLIACPLAAALTALLAMRRSFVVVEVTGASMIPALMPGDRVLVRRGARGRLQVGRVVVFGKPLDDCLVWDGSAPPAPIQWTIKRVAALPGDMVPTEARPAVGDVAVVPPGMLVVLGDNVGSTDSRTWGFLPATAVLGVGMRRLGPSGSGPEI
jgi:signal peptidase I